MRVGVVAPSSVRAMSRIGELPDWARPPDDGRRRAPAPTPADPVEGRNKGHRRRPPEDAPAWRTPAADEPDARDDRARRRRRVPHDDGGDRRQTPEPPSLVRPSPPRRPTFVVPADAPVHPEHGRRLAMEWFSTRYVEVFESGVVRLSGALVANPPYERVVTAQFDIDEEKKKSVFDRLLAKVSTETLRELGVEERSRESCLTIVTEDRTHALREDPVTEQGERSAMLLMAALEYVIALHAPAPEEPSPPMVDEASSDDTSETARDGGDSARAVTVDLGDDRDHERVDHDVDLVDLDADADNDPADDVDDDAEAVPARWWRAARQRSEPEPSPVPTAGPDEPFVAAEEPVTPPSVQSTASLPPTRVDLPVVPAVADPVEQPSLLGEQWGEPASAPALAEPAGAPSPTVDTGVAPTSESVPPPTDVSPSNVRVGPRSPADRLRELVALWREGLITDLEYERKRQQLLDEL